MATVAQFTFNTFMENTYIVYDDSKECIILDPGCHSQPEKDELRGFIDKQKLKPVRLINTHCHVDHVLGNRFVSELYKLDLEIHKADLELLRSAPETGSSYGIAVEPSPDPTVFLEPGERLEFGQTSFEIMFTPGHSPGSVSFYCEEDEFVIVGDVLFLSSIGRYDFPDSNYDDLMESIKIKLFALKDEVKVYSGHGPETTIGFERKTNPFVGETAGSIE